MNFSVQGFWGLVRMSLFFGNGLMTTSLPVSPAKMLRKHCRQQRRSLSKTQQIQHGQQATSLLLKSAWLQRPKKIAIFLSEDGELETRLLIKRLWQSHHTLYLPVMRNVRQGLKVMAFAAYHPHTKLQPNQFKMLEPADKNQTVLQGRQLDLIITPLTCFDALGSRIGMGGGFYDRTFAFKRRQLKHQLARPKLIGWAHECQQVEQIVREDWDVPLDGLVSETKIYYFK